MIGRWLSVGHPTGERYGYESSRSGHDGYGITEPVPNLTRVIVEGETVSEWLRITIAPRSDDLFSWDRVQLD